MRPAIQFVSAALAFAALALGRGSRAIAADSVDPAADAKAFQKYFTDKFPKLKLEDFVNGPYSMNEDMHRQWVEKEEFPPYEFSLDPGKEMFSKPFKNGKSYADCFPEQGHRHPPELSVFRREGRQGRHAGAGAEPLPRGQWRGAVLLCEGRHGRADRLYGVHLARQAVRHQDPERSARAGGLSRTASEYFYTRRGQLNFSCASCHVQNPGERIRAEILAPALGILNAMPIYRSEWGGMGTISRRFTTCNSQTRGVPLDPQSDEYRDLEYYLSYVSNGLPISGPGARP